MSIWPVSHFDPRSREGSDQHAQDLCQALEEFRSTLPRRERLTAWIYLTILCPFRSTLPRRERRARSAGDHMVSFYFDPRSREGSDNNTKFLPPTIGNFDPRSREGSDDTEQHHFSFYEQFRSTLPRRERPDIAWEKAVVKMDFDPRSREGSDRQCGDLVLHGVGISIHAPAKGATRTSYMAGRYRQIFRSTLPRRERPAPTPANGEAPAYFDPRSREGSDIFGKTLVPAGDISIHAPAKGATRKPGRSTRSASDFDPRSREGSDSVSVGSGFRKRNFDPRSREGSDVSSNAKGAKRTDFDPRSREGSDRRARHSRRASAHFDPRSREGSDCCSPACR